MKRPVSYNSGKASTLLILLILIPLLVVGFKIGKAYFDNATFKNEVEEIASRALLNPNLDIVEQIVGLAVINGIKMRPDDIIYNRDVNKGTIDIRLLYARNIDLTFTQYEMSFAINVRKDLSREKSLMIGIKNDLEETSEGADKRKTDSVNKALGK